MEKSNWGPNRREADVVRPASRRGSLFMLVSLLSGKFRVERKKAPAEEAATKLIGSKLQEQKALCRQGAIFHA